MRGEDGNMEIVWLDVSMSRRSEKIVTALHRAARSEKCPATREQLRKMAQKIEVITRPPRKFKPRAVRPPDDDNTALMRVINGNHPYPVLSKNDARRALVALRASCSIAELSRRLHIDPRTVSRWILEYKEGTWDLEA